MTKRFYDRRLNDASRQLEEFKSKSSKLAFLRLLSFSVVLLGLILFFFDKKLFYLIASFTFFVGFIVLVINHDKVIKKIQYYRFLIETLYEYIYRFDDRWTSFKETGIEFANDELPFLHDLDIIGDASLFQYLNVSKTHNGKRKLVERLSNPELTKDELQSQQQSMQEISEHIDFSLDFQVALKIYEDEGASLNLNYIRSHLETKIDFSKANIYLAIVFTIVSFMTLVLALFGKISWTYFIVICVFQLIDALIHQYRNKEVFSDMHSIAFTIVMLERVYHVIHHATFKDERLKKLQSDIRRYGLGGIKEINKIRAIESFNHFFVTNLLFNGLFSINIWIIYFFKKFIDRFGIHFFKSIEALEEFEVIASLAILGQTKQVKTLPELTSDVSLNFVDLKHPLIPEDECVSNRFQQENRINIITGSNMSGKTSFLRMIGINIILMNAGAYCHAESFRSPYLKVFTSMRIKDDISKGISTFYAELLRIKSAIEYAEKGKPMIVFVDEIFKGTNSNDRIKGAISLIEKLNQPHIILFISTHDFELCDIKSVKVKNYHFSEYYEGDKIKFDYTLKHGRCQTTNAKYLMKIAGIID